MPYENEENIFIYTEKLDLLLSELDKDVQKNYGLLESNPSQVNMRNFVRSLFSLYDAILIRLKDQVFDLLEQEALSNGININKFIPLLDEVAFLTKNGGVKLQPNRFSFLALVGYCFKEYARLGKFDGDILSDHRWNDFKESVYIRNRITHPSIDEGIKISDKDLEILKSGRNWWNETVKKLQNLGPIKF